MGKKGVVLMIVAALVLTAAATALGVPEGRVLEFETPMGKVVFDGTVHGKQFASCNDCHRPGLFDKMRRKDFHITMAEIYDGKFCGSCHNGKVAFNALDNCARCHIM